MKKIPKKIVAAMRGSALAAFGAGLLALPCSAQVVRIGGPEAMMARSADIMTGFFAAPAPGVASVAGIVSIAGKVSTPELAPLAPAVQAGAAEVVRAAASGAPVPALAPKLAVLSHPSVFQLLTESQKAAVEQLSRQHADALKPHGDRMQELLKNTAVRLRGDPDRDDSVLEIHSAGGSVGYRSLTEPRLEQGALKPSTEAFGRSFSLYDDSGPGRLRGPHRPPSK